MSGHPLSLIICLSDPHCIIVFLTCWLTRLSPPAGMTSFPECWVTPEKHSAQRTSRRAWCSHNTLWNQNDPFQSDPPTDKSKSCMPPTAWNCARGNKSDVRYPRYLLIQHQERKNVIASIDNEEYKFDSQFPYGLNHHVSSIADSSIFQHRQQ